MDRYVAGEIFKNIKTDERVNSKLTHCLYCTVSSNEGSLYESLQYEIKLDCINGPDFKQCPACKRIYICKDNW